MRSGLVSALAMAMLMGAGFSVSPSPQATRGTTASEPNAERAKPANQNPAVQRSTQYAAFRAAVGGGWRRRTYPGLGWPVAHDRRMARKKRNQRRNRSAHRG